MTHFERTIECIEERYRALTGDFTIAFLGGAIKRSQNTQVRRVRFVRPGGTVAPPVDTGSETGQIRKRHAWALRDTVVATIYAETDDAAEAILLNLLVVYYMIGTGIEPGAYEWLTEQPEGATNTKRSNVVALQATFIYDIAQEALTLTPIDSFFHRGEFGGSAFSPGFSTGFRFAGGELAC